MANQLDEYNIKLNNYIKNISTSKYLIELTKCCNYSEFLTVYKKKSLKDLYTDVKYHYDHLNIISLYILTENNEKIIIPNNENIILCDYINNNKNYFIPVYSVPSQIVYKIYLDYGNNCVNSEQNMIQDMDIDT